MWDEDVVQASEEAPHEEQRSHYCQRCSVRNRSIRRGGTSCGRSARRDNCHGESSFCPEFSQPYVLHDSIAHRQTGVRAAFWRWVRMKWLGLTKSRLLMVKR